MGLVVTNFLYEIDVSIREQNISYGQVLPKFQIIDHLGEWNQNLKIATNWRIPHFRHFGGNVWSGPSKTLKIGPIYLYIQFMSKCEPILKKFHTSRFYFYGNCTIGPEHFEMANIRRHFMLDVYQITDLTEHPMMEKFILS